MTVHLTTLQAPCDVTTDPHTVGDTKSTAVFNRIGFILFNKYCCLPITVPSQDDCTVPEEILSRTVRLAHTMCCLPSV